MIDCQLVCILLKIMQGFLLFQLVFMPSLVKLLVKLFAKLDNLTEEQVYERYLA